ncbi:MAG: hypothetical protein GEU71_03085 [Actinobacteria bacterium]|nr:hypothetical protein [Actinomycetota bacterium]
MSSRDEFLLLKLLVEAHWNVPPARTQDFLIVQTLEGDFLVHAGLPRGRVSMDGRRIRDLESQGLLVCDETAPGITEMRLESEGFKCYEESQTRLADPAMTIESEVTVYLDGEDFQSRHVRSYGEWSEAQNLLWRTGGIQDYGMISHLCEVAMEQFADEALVTSGGRDDGSGRSSLEQMRDILERSDVPEKSLMLTLLAYWVSVLEAAKSYPHQLETIAWENVRRLVFNTAFVMFEFDKAITFFPICIFCSDEEAAEQQMVSAQDARK